MLYALQTASDAQASGGGVGSLFSGTPWIDIVGLGVLTLFVVLGIRHGLVWQVVRLIGMLIAVGLARMISPELVPKFEAALSLPERACEGIVWFLVFVATLIVASLIGMVGRRAIEAVQLGPMDRIGGAMAGAATGVVVHCAFLVLMSSVGTAQWANDTFKGSASASMLDSLSRKSHILLNAQAAERIMDPWGQYYDQEVLRRQQERAAEMQRRSLEKADDLERQAARERARAAEKAAAGVR